MHNVFLSRYILKKYSNFLIENVFFLNEEFVQVIFGNYLKFLFLTLFFLKTIFCGTPVLFPFHSFFWLFIQRKKFEKQRSLIHGLPREEISQQWGEITSS